MAVEREAGVTLNVFQLKCHFEPLPDMCGWCIRFFLTELRHHMLAVTRSAHHNSAVVYSFSGNVFNSQIVANVSA
eukprot:4593707-Amphidinium_carterae.1